jgi:hypothetical protein
MPSDGKKQKPSHRKDVILLFGHGYYQYAKYRAYLD